MPYPAQITLEMLLETARQMLEGEGIEGLSLHKLAEQLGVKAPSLYRHVENKTDLLRAINQVTNERMVTHLESAIGTTENSVQAVYAMLNAYREFAHQNPVCYQLAFNTAQFDLRPDAQLLEQLALPLQGAIGQVAGAEVALTALRGAWALAHGFVMLELNHQFQRGGDLDEVFRQSVAAYLQGWMVK